MYLRADGADPVHHKAGEDGERLQDLDHARQPEAVDQAGLRSDHLWVFLIALFTFGFVCCVVYLPRLAR